MLTIMTTRHELEAREAAARDEHDGWVGEFVAWIPYALGVAVLMALLMIGMMGIETGSFNPFS